MMIGRLGIVGIVVITGVLLGCLVPLAALKRRSRKIRHAGRKHAASETCGCACSARRLARISYGGRSHRPTAPTPEND